VSPKEAVHISLCFNIASTLFVAIGVLEEKIIRAFVVKK
jgi:hypothetical protein